MAYCCWENCHISHNALSRILIIELSKLKHTNTASTFRRSIPPTLPKRSLVYSWSILQSIKVPIPVQSTEYCTQSQTGFEANFQTTSSQNNEPKLLSLLVTKAWNKHNVQSFTPIHHYESAPANCILISCMWIVINSLSVSYHAIS